MVKVVGFLIETFLPGCRLKFRAITQERENFSIEGNTEDSVIEGNTEDSVKARSGAIVWKVKLVSTSATKSASGPGLISLKTAVSHHSDTGCRCFHSASYCFFREFGLHSKNTVLCVDRKPVRSAMVLSSYSFY